MGEGKLLTQSSHHHTFFLFAAAAVVVVVPLYNQTGIVWGGETGINTFVGHQFEVIELSVGHNGSRCLHKECRRTRFQINENEDQGGD